MTEELRTDKEPVEAVKEEFPPKKTPTIKFGKLRERVKKGELDPRDVLNWYKEQEEQWSENLVTFLKNQIVAQRTKKAEKKEEKEEKRQKKNRNKKGKKRRNEQGRRPAKGDRRETKRAPRA